MSNADTTYENKNDWTYISLILRSDLRFAILGVNLCITSEHVQHPILIPADTSCLLQRIYFTTEIPINSTSLQNYVKNSLAVWAVGACHIDIHAFILKSNILKSKSVTICLSLRFSFVHATYWKINAVPHLVNNRYFFIFKLTYSFLVS